MPRPDPARVFVHAVVRGAMAQLDAARTDLARMLAEPSGVPPERRKPGPKARRKPKPRAKAEPAKPAPKPLSDARRASLARARAAFEAKRRAAREAHRAAARPEGGEASVATETTAGDSDEGEDGGPRTGKTDRERFRRWIVATRELEPR